MATGSPKKGKIKVSIVDMGREIDKNKDVKEYILQLQPRTKIIDVIEYLNENGKIRHIQVSMALEKGGTRIPEGFTIQQTKELAKNQNEPIRLFMYEETPTLGLLKDGSASVQYTRAQLVGAQAPSVQKAPRPQPANSKQVSNSFEPEQKKQSCCCSTM